MEGITDDCIVTEPARRNTAPCITYANFKIMAKNPEANIVVAPSDHLILKEDEKKWTDLQETGKKVLEFRLLLDQIIQNFYWLSPQDSEFSKAAPPVPPVAASESALPTASSAWSNKLSMVSRVPLRTP